MLKHFYFIPAFVCAYLVQFGAFAVPNCPKGEGVTETQCKQTAGCEWSDTGGCNYCAGNDYFDTTDQTCKACPADTYPNSAEGSTNGDTDCYRGCKPSDIGEGVKTVSGIIYKPSGNSAEDKSDCKVVSCETTGGTCNKGYHKDGNSCVENVTNQGCSDSEYKFYQTASDSYSSCYKAQSACTTGTMTFVPSGNMCESVPYGTCVSSKKDCSQIDELRTSCGNNEIAGTVPVTISDFLPQYTNYTNCRCIKKNQPLKNDQDTNIGLATITYNFTNSGELGSVVSTDVTSCNAGYCRQSETATTCIQVPAGQYSGSGELQCHHCAPGATSDAGSTKTTECHYTKDTVFSDEGGSFRLPVGDDAKINIEWNWSKAI